MDRICRINVDKTRFELQSTQKQNNHDKNVPPRP